MKKTKKEYCVHIYEQYHEYENIMATSPEQAELIAVERHNGGNYDEISQVEIMQVCHCNEDEATDNDIENKVCDNCGKKL